MEGSSPAGVRARRIMCEIVPRARPVPSLRDDVERGLLAPPRRLPPKYFYDERGSRLFDRICETPEYYLTRTEDALLAESARAIIECARPDDILELGSGTSRKTRRLLDACAALGLRPTYSPFDISEETLCAAAEALVDDYDWLSVNVLVGDYEGGLDRLPEARGRRLFCFLGSTIGNFEPGQAAAFLSDVRRRMKPDDLLLLGADRAKDPAVLDAAYNDSAGITAAFNLNLLSVLNDALAGDFAIDAFAHRAFFNEEASRIEMHLVSRRAQTVTLRALDTAIHVGDGESIRTELSHKFTAPALARLLARGGFTTVAHFAPANEYFSLVLAKPLDS